MSITPSKSMEQLLVSRPVGEIAPDILPGDGAVSPYCKDRWLCDPAVAVHPDVPVLDHAALWVTKEREGKQQLVHHGSVLLDGIDRDSGEVHAFFDESVPSPCVRGQLPVAVRSPIAAIEDEQNRSTGEMVREAPSLALVVG